MKTVSPFLAASTAFLLGLGVIGTDAAAQAHNTIPADHEPRQYSWDLSRNEEQPQLKMRKIMAVNAINVLVLIKQSIEIYTSAAEPDMYEKRAPITETERVALREVFLKATGDAFTQVRPQKAPPEALHPQYGIWGGDKLTTDNLPEFMDHFKSAVHQRIGDDAVFTKLDPKVLEQIDVIFFQKDFNKDGKQSVYNVLDEALTPK